MEKLTDRLNFSDRKHGDKSVFIDRNKDINYFDTLCLYCANNDIDLFKIDDSDFIACVDLLENHMSDLKYNNQFYFYIK